MLKKLFLISAVAFCFPNIVSANSFVVRFQLTIPERLQIVLDRPDDKDFSTRENTVTSTETVNRNGKTVTLNSVVSR